MKKLVTLLFALSFTMVAFSKEKPAKKVPEKGYEIKVKIKGFNQPEAYLAYYFGDKQYIKDTAKVVNGEFVFKNAETALPGGIYLVVVPPKNNYFELLIDNDQTFSVSTDTLDLVGQVVITGCKENEIFYEDVHFLADQRKEVESLNKQIAATKDSAVIKPLQQKIKGIDEEVKSRRLKLIADNPDLLYAHVLLSLQELEIPEAPVNEKGEKDPNFQFFWYRNHFFDQLDLSDPRMLRTPIYNQKVSTYMDKLTVKQPDSMMKAVDYLVGKAMKNEETFQYLVVSLLNKYAVESKVMGMDALYVHMVEKYYMSGLATWADPENLKKMEERALALSPTLLGRPAPNFSVQNLSGQWVNMQSIKADYLVVYFWDYDCGHCKQVTPKLAKAFDEFKNYNVKLLTVSINGDVDVWKTKLKDMGLDTVANVMNCQDHARAGGFNGKYDIRSTPRLFVLDADKKIVAKQIDVLTMRRILNNGLGIQTFEEAEKEAAEKAARGEIDEYADHPEEGENSH